MKEDLNKIKIQFDILTNFVQFSRCSLYNSTFCKEKTEYIVVFFVN